MSAGNIKELNIQTFGTFQITGMGGELGVQNRCAKTLVKMIALLLAHRNENVSVQQLVDGIYPDDEDIVDPNSAVRNLMWRLRRLFVKVWGESGESFIVTKGSTYRWNESIRLKLDTDQFDEYIKAGNDASEPAQKIRNYMEAVMLYRGTYMNGYDDVLWIAYQATYYHSIYLMTVKKLAALLEAEGSFSIMEQVVADAIRTESLDEELYCLFIRALMKQGNIKMALEEYRKATAILYENLGFVTLNKLAALHEELMKETHKDGDNMSIIMSDLHETMTSGAFYCEYGVFRQIFQLEVRRAERMGISVFLSLVSVGIHIDGVTEIESEEDKKLLNRSMKTLQNVLRESLRSGDVITRYCSNQFIILLPTCQYETAGGVMQRIDKSFRNKIRDKRVRLNYNMNEML